MLRRVLRNIRRSELFRVQWLLFVLIFVQVLIHLASYVVGWEFFIGGMMVPAELVGSLHRLRGGEFAAGDGRVLATLVTHAFLHADWGHIVFNMLYLWVFAALAVELVGKRWMVVVFVVSAIFGGLCHVMMNLSSAVPMLGASGAVMGFMGFYFGLVARWRLPDPHVWPLAHPVPPAHLAIFALIGLAFDFAGLMDHEAVGVAYGAHIGGFVGGLALASFGAPKPKGAGVR